ncbi:hypothetical protein MUG91_G174n12 [Manis pentadactyla]|nr:hypothetical protein MUG91_G174n12 [Manis pentadactyla]
MGETTEKATEELKEERIKLEPKVRRFSEKAFLLQLLRTHENASERQCEQAVDTAEEPGVHSRGEGRPAAAREMQVCTRGRWTQVHLWVCTTLPCGHGFPARRT